MNPKPKPQEKPGEVERCEECPCRWAEFPCSECRGSAEAPEPPGDCPYGRVRCDDGSAPCDDHGPARQPAAPAEPAKRGLQTNGPSAAVRMQRQEEDHLTQVIHRVTLPNGVTVCRSASEITWLYVVIWKAFGQWQVHWHETYSAALEELERLGEDRAHWQRTDTSPLRSDEPGRTMSYVQTKPLRTRRFRGRSLAHSPGRTTRDHH